MLLNLGGMANLTYVPRRAQEDGVLAFDTGPGVAVIDGVAAAGGPAALVRSRRPHRRRRARPDEAVLAELLADPFFAAPPPKSTGRERFGDAYAAALHDARARAPTASPRRSSSPRGASPTAVGRWTPAGVGGRRLGRRVPPSRAHGRARAAPGAPAGGHRAAPVRATCSFPGDAKEAVAFALLGYLTLHGQPGNVPAATGAGGARVLGTVTPA